MRVDDDPAYENHLVRNPLDVLALLRSMQKLGCRFTDMTLLSLEHVRAYVNLLERDSLK